MTFAQILKQKKEKSNNIKTRFGLSKKNKALGIIMINNKALLQKLYFGLANLPINFIVVGDFGKEGIDEQFKNIYVKNKISDIDLIGFDFCVFDSEITDITKFNKNLIVSILPENNHFKSIMKEYQPMKNEGNCYLYSQNNEWSIFGSIVRYLENYKITFDNKNLVKNVFEG